MSNFRLTRFKNLSRMKWGALTALFIIVLLVVIFLLRTPNLTEEEIISRVEQIYGGEVNNVVHAGGTASILFTRDAAMYEIDMNKRTGSFSNLVVIFKEDPFFSDFGSPNVEGPQQLLTPSQANSIATSKYFGDVISNQFIESENGGYYKIIIASLTQQYTIHVDALTGEIILVLIES